MAVIINDFEIILEPPASAPEGPNREPAGEDTAQQKLTPHDLDSILRHRIERSLRLWAY